MSKGSADCLETRHPGGLLGSKSSQPPSTTSLDLNFTPRLVPQPVSPQFSPVAQWMKRNMFAALYLCLNLLLAASPSHARPSWTKGENEGLGVSRSEDAQKQPKHLVNAFDATQIAADKTVQEIGWLPSNRGTSTHERNVRQILHQSSLANRFLRPFQNLPLAVLNQGGFQQQSYGPPVGSNLPVRQPTGLLNIGAQIASQVQHLVDSRLISQEQQNLAAHESLSNQNYYQPPRKIPQFPVNNPGIHHHVKIGQPQVSIISTSQVQVTCSGNPQDCQKIPKLPLADFSQIHSSQQKDEITVPESHNQKDSSYTHNQDGGGLNQEQKTSDIIYSEASEQQHKHPGMPDDVDIRFKN